MPKTHTISNDLGRITGAVRNNVVQYRGLPYARVPGRFKDPIGPLHFLGDYDATRWGPIAVQPPDAENFDAKVLNVHPNPLPPHRKTMAELECTNLVIVTPYTRQHEQREEDRMSPTNKLLPTIVWVHGGANQIGSANFEPYDMRNLVAYSIDVARKPVVVVSVNHSIDAGVKQHIKEFGGDPENITFMGESAGSIAGSIHLYSQTPLLKRAILLSGLAGLLPPRPISAQNEIYKDTLEKLGLNKIPDSERVGRFLHINAAELGKIAFKVEICPTSDGKIVPTTEWLRYEGFGPLPEWCQSIVIGSCKDEWSVMQLGGGIENYKKPAQTFYNRLSSILTESEIKELFTCFKINETDPREDSITKLYILISEYGFRLPAWHFANFWTSNGKKAFLAQTYVGTLITGTNQGRAHHGINAVFSFQNFNNQMPEKGGYRELGGEMATNWLRYAYGEDPWTPFEPDEGLVKVYDVGYGTKEIRQRDLDLERWETWIVMERLGLDRVWEVGQKFLKGPTEGE